MRNVPRPHGITLLETALYIGMLAIVLPFLASFLVHTQTEQQLFDVRTRMEQTASLAHYDLARAMTIAQSVSISTSTLDNDAGVLRWRDDTGTLVVIDRPTVVVSFPSGTQNVRRLRYQRGTDAAVYLTDADIDVTAWRVSAVRSTSNTLTGLRLSLDLAMIAPGDGPFRAAAFAFDTTVTIQSQTIEN